MSNKQKQVMLMLRHEAFVVEEHALFQSIAGDPRWKWYLSQIRLAPTAVGVAGHARSGDLPCFNGHGPEAAPVGFQDLPSPD